jgi:hypothetical protein
MDVRRKVGVKDTPTNNQMNIYLLNIPFAVLGVAIAIVPLIIGMKHETRTEPDDNITPAVATYADHYAEEYEHAA